MLNMELKWQSQFLPFLFPKYTALFDCLYVLRWGYLCLIHLFNELFNMTKLKEIISETYKKNLEFSISRHVKYLTTKLIS